MCKKLIFVLVVFGIAMPASALITYVDANVPVDVGNSSPATTGSAGTDDLWRFRAFANNGTIYESGGAWGTGNTEDCMRLLTRITNVPGNALGYEVYAYFWSDGSSWRIRASLTNDKPELPLYIAGQPGTSNFCTQNGSTQYSDGGCCGPNPFTTSVMVTEGNRELWQADLGAALVGSDPGQTYTINVYIDDDPAHLSHDNRTWYDGVGYEAIPEPATIALLGLGGLALLRKKRA